jgi:hypothetical protein
MNKNLQKVLDRAELNIDSIDRNSFDRFVKEFINECIYVMSDNDYHGEWLGEQIKSHFNIETLRLPAKNLSGILIRGVDGEMIFRVYNNDETFLDYSIAHSDLEVRIISDDATLYHSGSNYVLDYSPEVLGIPNFNFNSLKEKS